MADHHNVTAVVLAAGSGRRLGSDVPKQFLPLCGQPMLDHSLAVFEACPEVGAVVVAFPPGTEGEHNLEGFSKVASRVAGEATRQGSLKQALKHLPPPTDTVMVHDAARPLLDCRLIDDLLAALDDRCDGVIPAIPLEDTIKKVSDGGMVTGEMDRRSVWRVQTPQVFRRAVIEDALAEAIESGYESTDCSQLLTRLGYRVRVVEGDPLNFKVTQAADLWLAEQVMLIRSNPKE